MATLVLGFRSSHFFVGLTMSSEAVRRGTSFSALSTNMVCQSIAGVSIFAILFMSDHIAAILEDLLAFRTGISPSFTVKCFFSENGV